MPRVLVLHLSRFRLGGKGGWVKNNLKVDFPEVLALGDVFEGLDMNYRLLGFVSHAGTMQAGHYISVARVGDGYFMFNDDTVTPVLIDRARNLQAYMLFYEMM
jgi:ubiquitin carboxyl-terminal hydrolase 4/11/15